jgi:hypothetical protein
MNSKDISLMQNLKKLVLFAAILSLCIGWATDAAAEKTFFCKATIANDGDGSPVSLSGPLVYDMGTVGSCTDVQYATRFDLKCAGPANSACSTKALQDANFNNPAFWCAKGVPDGSTIRAYAAVGPPVAPKGRYNTAQTQNLGVLINKPAVTKTTYDCDQFPGTWLENPAETNGYRARCIKTSCNAISGVPAAPSWVSIGTPWRTATGPAWITDGSGNIWYTVPARATVTVIKAAECRWQ